MAFFFVAVKNSRDGSLEASLRLSGQVAAVAVCAARASCCWLRLVLSKAGFDSFPVAIISLMQLKQVGLDEVGHVVPVGWVPSHDGQCGSAPHRAVEWPYPKHLKHWPSFLVNFSTTFKTEKKFRRYFMALLASSGSLRWMRRDEKGFPDSIECRFAYLIESKESKTPKLTALRLSTSRSLSGLNEVGMP